MRKVGSAVGYGMSSYGLQIINKTLFVTYGFPSPPVLLLAQAVSAVVLIWTANAVGIIQADLRLSWALLGRLLPLNAVYAVQNVSGIAASALVSVPTFSTVRKFSIAFTLLAQWAILGLKPEGHATLAVSIMVLGSLLATWGDLDFSWAGYVLLTLCNVMTAAWRIMIRFLLEGKRLSSWTLLFYNSLFSASVLSLGMLFFSPTSSPPLLSSGSSAVARPDSASFSSPPPPPPPYYVDHPDLGPPHGLVEHIQRDPFFTCLFVLSCCLGFSINYFNYLCTEYNSPLTASVVGSIKSIVATYTGFLFSDYTYVFSSFLGHNLSMMGTAVYTGAQFCPSSVSRDGRDADDPAADKETKANV